MIVYRHGDARYPFLWESSDQPAARWHGEGDGPVQYFADTPDGAWAEFLRHEEIREESELLNVRRCLWAVELPEYLSADAPNLEESVMTGSLSTYTECQAEARRIVAQGSTALRAPSAALLPRSAGGWKVDGGLHPGAPRDGLVYALFGPRPDLTGWVAATNGRPQPDLLQFVRWL